MEIEEKLEVGFKFKRLEVWKRSIDWANAMFDVATELPRKYQYSLGEQLRRAALSVPTNITEGSGQDKPKERNYFCRIAKGSVYEVMSLLVMTGKRGFLARDDYKTLCAEANEIAAMLTKLTNT